jgi:hypothetical protein
MGKLWKIIGKKMKNQGKLRQKRQKKGKKGRKKGKI